MTRINIHPEDAQFMRELLSDEMTVIDSDSSQTARINHSLLIAIKQRKSEIDTSWKKCILFFITFLSLYTALGASLTLDMPSGSSGHKSIEYALQAIPVLIAFSGFFVSILFLFLTRASARKQMNWERSIHILEKYSSGNLFKLTHAQGAGTSNYSIPLIYISLAYFICLTWLIIYNYLTFTTSGVFGSVISLFISTMAYVILDIQLLKPFKHSIESEPARVKQDDKNQE